MDRAVDMWYKPLRALKVAKCAAPFIRRCGGKTSVLPHLVRILRGIPMDEYYYCEPLVGGGALYWAVGASFKAAWVSDNCPHLMNLYTVVRDCSEDLIAELSDRGTYWYHSHYRDVRGLLNSDGIPVYPVGYQTPSMLNYRRVRSSLTRSPGTSIVQAARVYYLGATAINGLLRPNQTTGHINSAPGQVRAFQPDVRLLRYCSEHLANTTILCESAISLIPKFVNSVARPFLFVDSPYHDNDPRKYTKYTKSFTVQDQIDLANVTFSSGASFIYCNKATDLILSLIPSDVSVEFHDLKHKVGPGGCRGNIERELFAYRL